MTDPPNNFFNFIPPGFKFNLSIPKSFLTNLDGWRSKQAILRRGRHKWPVHIGDGGAFRHGWRKFVVENGVQELDFIVFKHQGNMVFDFIVFDQSACEREYPSLNDDVEVSPQESNSLHTRERSTMVKKRKRADDSSQSKDELRPNNHDDRCFVARMTPYNISTSRLNVPMKLARSNGLITKRRHTQTVLVDEAKRTWPATLDVKARQVHLTGWRKVITEYNLKVGDTCTFELIRTGSVPVFNFSKRSTMVKKRKRADDELRPDDDDDRCFVTRMTPYNISTSRLNVPMKLARSNGLITKRRHTQTVLVDEANRTWPATLDVKARQVHLTGWRKVITEYNLKVGDTCTFELIKTGNVPVFNFNNLGKKPKNNHTHVKKATSLTRYFISTLKPCNFKNSRLYLPVEFSISNDLQVGEMILRDDKGRSRKVQLNKIGKNQFYLGNGFRDFWVTNRLMEGDAYKIELVQNKKNKLPVMNFSYLKPTNNHTKLKETSSTSYFISTLKPYGSERLILVTSDTRKSLPKTPIFAADVVSTPSELEDHLSYLDEVKSYYVERSMLYLPREFSVKNGLLNKKEMILKNADQRSWSVDIKRYKNSCYLGGGWKEFAAANRLKKGHVFKLELVSNGEIPVGNFLVHKVH